MAAAVTLSHRYIPSRQLPDKAVSLLDTACSRVALGLHATPARLESVVRQLEALEVEKDIVQRELGLGVGDAGRFADIGTAIERLLAEKAELQERFEREKVLVQQIVDAEAALLKPAGKPGAARAAQAPAPATAPAHASEASGEAGSGGAAAAGTAQGAAVSPGVATPEALAALRQDLARLQGEDPLLQPVVDASVVAAVVAEWTGIPVGRMVRDEVQSVLTLADTLEKRVIGQRHGLEAITRRIQTARAQLDNPGKPIGVFLLAGPSGVGKTETALSLAEALYGGEQNLITINMSEYQEAHTVSTLKGAPPGYVGYGEGGVLTEAVRRRPYSVVLLDEIEKAHPDVHELFFQVFDKGWMEDGEGRYIDFKNTVIIPDFQRGLGADRRHVPGSGAGAPARGTGPGGAQAAAGEIPGRAAGPAGGGAVLPDLGRDARADHPPAAAAHPDAHRRAPRRRAGHRRCGRAAHSPALHRGGIRRPDGGRNHHPEPAAAAGDALPAELCRFEVDPPHPPRRGGQRFRHRVRRGLSRPRERVPPPEGGLFPTWYIMDGFHGRWQVPCGRGATAGTHGTHFGRYKGSCGFPFHFAAQAGIA